LYSGIEIPNSQNSLKADEEIRSTIYV